MDVKERIYVPPKRGRLPWRYQERLEMSLKQQLRLMSIVLTLCAGMAGLFWVVLK